MELDLALSDRLVDMVEEGYDVAIRITREPSPALIARRLGESRVSLCGAGPWPRAHPQHPQELQAHACLSYSYWAAGDHWPLQGPGGEIKVAVNSLLHANNGDVLREAAIAGMGVILQPDFLLEDALADGRLVRVLPEWEASPIGIFAVYTSRSHLAPKVRSFIDHLVESGV